MSLTREEIAERCVATSIDKLTMNYDKKKVVYTHSFRDVQGAVLEEFLTEVHFSVLQPRPITSAEEHALLAFGLCHSTYVFLPAAKRAPLLQIRAGYLSPEELKFFRPALAGALAEYFYLADLDLADFQLECCCDPPLPEGKSELALGTATAAAAAAQTPAPAADARAQEDAPPGPASPDSSLLAASPSSTVAPTADDTRPLAALQPLAAALAEPPSRSAAEPLGSLPPRPPAPASADAATAPGTTPSTAPAAHVQPPPPHSHSDLAQGSANAPYGPPRVLVPFGGGKDSTLLMELLSSMGAQVGWIYYGEWVGSWEVYTKFTRLAEASPAGTVALVEQNLPCLERLNELNLVPGLAFPDYTAYVSFYTFASAFVALQLDYDYICVGNEFSANAINTTHPRYNYPVNHQYEKSFAAECAFHAYLRDFIHPRLYYFSGLQHMTELEIAQRFAAICAAKYLDLIISCNYAMDDDWCGGCEKCTFVFVLFAAFLPVADIMEKVFGVAPASSDIATGADAYTSGAVVPGSRESLRGVCDMYNSERHVPVFESLMGLSGHKPFECVGTPEEVLAAMYLTVRKYKEGASGRTRRPRGKNNGAADGLAAATETAAAAGAGEPGDGQEATLLMGHAGKAEKVQQQEGEEAVSEEGLPLLLRKHLGLITSKGRMEWEKIWEAIRTVTETGQADVPTLYPDWFKQGVKEMGRHARKD